MALAKQKGAKRAVMLPMSAPSHCSLMKPAAERLRERLAAIEVRKPMVPVIHNRSSRPTTIPARIRQALVEQLYHPVRWIEIVQLLGAQGRHAHRRVRAGQGAHGPVQAHRRPTSNTSRITDSRRARRGQPHRR